MKAAEVKKKARQKKNREKSQINSIKKLALGNNQIGTFKGVFSDLPVDLSSNFIQPPTLTHRSEATQQKLDLLPSVSLQNLSKKHAAAMK